MELNFLQSEDSFDLNTFVMYLFVLLTPGLLEIFFFESNTDKVERMHGELDDQIRNLTHVYEMEQSIHENIHENNDSEDCINVKVLCIFTWFCCCGCLKLPCFGNRPCKCCYALEEVKDKKGKKSFITTHFNLFETQNEVGDSNMNNIEMNRNETVMDGKENKGQE
jgi:hypothetical protein